MATMKDVAKRAAVSVATVSHVVNGTRYVEPSTRERVLEAISFLHYEKDPVAGSLRTGRTHTIGLVMSTVTNPYFSDVVAGIERISVERGYGLLIADHRDDSNLEFETVSRLVRQRVDGILLQPSDAPDRSFDLLIDKGVPTVLVDRRSPRAPGPFDFVGTENRAATRALVEHLIGHGHRRVALVAGAPGSSTTDERTDGYRAALSEAGLPVDPLLVRSGRSSEAGAAAAVGELLALTDPPTALLSANNRMTIGVLKALHEHGIVPPTGLALAAFDDFAWADFVVPRLTCVRQQGTHIGARSFDLLMRRMTSTTDDPPVSEQPAAELVIRESCGCGS